MGRFEGSLKCLCYVLDVDVEVFALLAFLWRVARRAMGVHVWGWSMARVSC